MRLEWHALQNRVLGEGKINMKRWNHILNTLMCVSIGVFIGNCGYVVYDFKARPGLYEMQSASWYTSILMYGAATLVIVISCIVIKVILNYKLKSSKTNVGKV